MSKTRVTSIKNGGFKMEEVHEDGTEVPCSDVGHFDKLPQWIQEAMVLLNISENHTIPTIGMKVLFPNDEDSIYWLDLNTENKDEEATTAGEELGKS